jgi:hypothetical protein
LARLERGGTIARAILVMSVNNVHPRGFAPVAWKQVALLLFDLVLSSSSSSSHVTTWLPVPERALLVHRSGVFCGLLPLRAMALTMFFLPSFDFSSFSFLMVEQSGWCR